jgi:hypothetical protein
MDVKGALTDPEDIIAVPWHWLSRQHRWGMEMLEPCQATLAHGGHRWIKKMVQWYPSAVLVAKRVQMKQGEVAASPSATLTIERPR